MAFGQQFLAELHAGPLDSSARTYRRWKMRYAHLSPNYIRDVIRANLPKFGGNATTQLQTLLLK